MLPDLTPHHLFPRLLLDLLSIIDERDVRTRARDGRFALVEHCCHLADLEEEGYGRRIERLLLEDSPTLPDFAGDLIAEQRRYIEQAPLPAAERFIRQREENLLLLGGLHEEEWGRRGMQEGVGDVSIVQVAEMMLEHDRGHARDLVALLPELSREAPPALTAFAFAGPSHA